MGNGLAIGAGIAKGAENFVNSYMQARAYSNQQKMLKHQVILSALYKNLEDENLPYNERARIFDAIPGLMGIKLDAPLSHMMGLHDLLDKDVETQSAIEATPAKAGTPASTITDERVNNQVSAEDVQLAGTINQQATQDVPAGIGREQITEKFGDLSPTKYKQLITTRQQDIDTGRSLEAYRRKAEIDFELQQDSYKAQGYNKVVTEGFNANGEYVVLMSNQSNDIKEVKMPKGFAPTKILARSNSTLPAPVRAYQAYFETQVNPLTGEKYTQPEAQAAALEYYKHNGDVMFGLTEAQRKATTQGAELRNTGSMPPSPAERQAAEDRKISREDRREDKITEAERLATEAAAKVADVTATHARAKAAYDEAEQAFNSWVMQNGDTGEGGALSSIFGKPDTSKLVKYNINGKTYYVDPDDLADDEVKILRNNLDSRRKELEAIETQKRTYEGVVKAQEQKINNLRKRSANSGGSSSNGLTPTQQRAVDFARSKNPKLAAGKTDIQVWEAIKSKLAQ